MYSPQKVRRVRIILSIVAVLVVIALLAIIVTFLIRGSNDAVEAVPPRNSIQLDDILQSKLVARHFNGSWSRGSNILYRENNVRINSIN